MQELKKVRRNGFAIGRSERIPGGAGVAVPVRGPQDEVVAALAISTPSSRFEPARLPEYLRWLTRASEQIGSALGRGRKTR